jgi:hypothetical protein
MKKQILFTAIFLSFLGFDTSAFCTWTGATSSLWSEPTNWDCGHVPTMMDEVIIPSSSSITMDITSTIKSLDISSGAVIDGGGTVLSVTDAIVWKGGTLAANVTLLSDGAMTMLTSSAKTLSKKLILKSSTSCTWDAGTFNINTGGEMMVESGASFGTSFNGFIDFTSGTRGKITNAGLFAKAGGTGTSHVHVDFENATTGVISAGTGTLEFLYGMMNIGGASIAAGATLLILDDSSHGGSATFSGSGTLELDGDNSHTFSCTYSGGLSLILDATSVAIDGSMVFMGSVLLESGTVSGAGTLGIGGTGDWSGGTLDLACTLGGVASLTLSGSDTKTLESAFSLLGTTTWSAGDLAVQNGGSLSNAGTFSASSTGNVTFSGSAGSISNPGTFRKTTLGTLTIPVSFSNSGTVKGTGTLLFSGGLTNTGTVAPGLSPGTLTISGNYTNGSLLDIEIENDGMGNTTKDLLVVSNNATLDGTLKVTETGTVPAGTYVILQCQGASPCIIGTFDAYDLPSGYTASITATEVSITKTALPVELLSFSAKPNENGIQLDWTTASERNADRFDIEYSTDGLRFAKIGERQAAGTTQVEQQYDFLHENPAAGAVNYYRLRQVDFDGVVEYSEVEAVDLTDLQDLSNLIRVFPNPVSNGELNLVIPEATGEAATARLFSPLGQLVRSTTVGRGFHPIDLDGLPSGIYNLEVLRGQVYFFEKILIASP